MVEHWGAKPRLPQHPGRQSRGTNYWDEEGARVSQAVTSHHSPKMSSSRNVHLSLSLRIFGRIRPLADWGFSVGFVVLSKRILAHSSILREPRFARGRIPDFTVLQDLRVVANYLF